MSGFSGILTSHSSGIESASLRMEAAIRHRGPDGVGRFVGSSDGVALSYLALDAFGENGVLATHFVETDSVVVAIDGHILNAAATLQRLGKPPSAEGRADADAAIAAYEAGGADWLARLDGPFSLVLWDKRTRRLTLARDRMGEKPLYYYANESTKTTLFSSEVKGILAHPDLKPELDRESLGMYFGFGFIPGPGTLFSGICKLLPGESVVCERPGVCERRTFYHLPKVSADLFDEEYSIKTARDLFMKGLEAYVGGAQKVGVFFSGGIDSSIIVAGLRELGVRDVDTFTIGIQDDTKYTQRREDLEYARVAAKAFATNHSELVLEPGRRLSPDLEKVVYQFDDLLMSPNTYTKYLLTGMAKEAGVDSALTGLGSGGQMGFWKPSKLAERLQQLQDFATSEEFSTDEERYYKRRGRLLSLEEQQGIFKDPLKMDRKAALKILSGCIADIKCDEKPEEYQLRSQFFSAVIAQPEKHMRSWEMTCALHGIETLSPFVSTPLMEFSTRLPLSIDGESYISCKTQLLKGFKDLLPEEVITRKVIGYPSYYWYRGELDGYQQRLFTRERIEANGILSYEGVQDVLARERQVLKKASGKMTWMLNQFALWYEIYFNKNPEFMPQT